MPGAWQRAAGRLAAGGPLVRSTPRAALLIAACCATVACAINPRIELEALAPENEPVLLSSVPFHAQTEYQCGPAALAGVLGASGVAITPDELTPQVYLPKRRGSLQVELMAATRRAGRIAYVLEPEIETLLGEVRAGRPVMVLQNLRTRGFPVWHYAVLVGFDATDNTLYLNSGKHEHLSEGARTFLRTWDWAGRWAMVALKPGELPDEPEALRFFQAVADFEAAAGSASAREAWQAASARWPGDYRPHFALGNAAMKSGGFRDAIGHYRQALNLSPGQAVVENNLAEALAASGCPRAAEKRLDSFLGGLAGVSPWREDLTATLADLRQIRGQDPAQCAQLIPD